MLGPWNHDCFVRPTQIHHQRHDRFLFIHPHADGGGRGRTLPPVCRRCARRQRPGILFKPWSRPNAYQLGPIIQRGGGGRLYPVRPTRRPGVHPPPKTLPVAPTWDTMWASWSPRATGCCSTTTSWRCAGLFRSVVPRSLPFSSRLFSFPLLSILTIYQVSSISIERKSYRKVRLL